MKRVFINGLGAVSPAGWGLPAFRDALAKGAALSPKELAHPAGVGSVRMLQVPAQESRPSFLMHPRLRRTSAISQYAVGAAQEALLGISAAEREKVGVLVCVFSGGVHYSRRFYQETLNNPATASPMLFPETVFNAPASHISAFLGSRAINYTLVGDTGTFLVGVATAAHWVGEGKVEHCLVVGTEEADWLAADALRLFAPKVILSEGAGAVLISSVPSSGIELLGVSDEYLYSACSRGEALRRALEELGMASNNTALALGVRETVELSQLDQFWPAGGLCLRPAKILGEGLAAGAAWQLVAACDALMHQVSNDAVVAMSGFHQHAIAARVSRTAAGDATIS